MSTLTICWCSHDCSQGFVLNSEGDRYIEYSMTFSSVKCLEKIPGNPISSHGFGAAALSTYTDS